MTDETGEPPTGDGAAQASAPAAPAADLGRRRFFRAFAGELFQTAATVAGAAQALQRASAEAAGAILNPNGAVGIVPGVTGPGGPSGPGGFRTAFREEDGILVLVDQRRLPDAVEEYSCRSAGEVAYAIREMVVRGGPAIGAAAAIGLALTAAKMRGSRPYARRATLRGGANALINARPTAVNLRWAVERVMARYEAIGDLVDDGDAIAQAMRVEADAIVLEATTDHGRLATFGLDILPRPADRAVNVLTHGNTGALAGGQFGTALGVIQAAHHAERPIHVWVDETRPYLNGARLTTWELAQSGVSHALVADAAAGHLMAIREVDVILVGAERVTASGDTVNDLGTYGLAVLAAHHGLPFYVCAPTTSLDLATPDGSEILIEDRKPEDLLVVRGASIAPPGTQARNPALDVTPAELISGIITEEGVVRAPFEPGLRAVSEVAHARWAALRDAAAVPLATPT